MKETTAGMAADQSESPTMKTSVKDVPRIVVPVTLQRPHRLIQRTMRDLLTVTRVQNGRFRPPKGCLDIVVSQACRKRAYRIMDTLIKACEARKWPVSVPSGDRAGTTVDVQGCEISVHLGESMRQVPREMTSLEKLWEKHPILGRKRPPYDLVPTGELNLRFECWGCYYQRQWRDAPQQPLEDILGEVVAGMEAGRDAKIEKDKADAEAEERKRAAEKTRTDLVEACRRQQDRIDKLLADADSWERSRKVHAYIDAWILRAETVSGMKIVQGSDVDKWVTWARMQADRLDPLADMRPVGLADERQQSSGG